MEVEATTHDDGTFLYERDASCHFQDVTLDASLRLNNALSRRLEPFHTEELVEFDVAYTAVGVSIKGPLEACPITR